MRIIRYISILFFIIFGILYFYKRPVQYQVMTGQTMGTYYSIKIKTDNKNKSLDDAVKKELALINSQMSVFDPDSEISGINKEVADKWMDLSPEMQTVLKNAHNIYLKSNGAFDPTIGQLIDLWGFGQKHPQKTPSEEEINEVLKISGFDNIKFSRDFSRMKKEYDITTINLSAIAKGQGVDRIAELLKKSGYQDFVVEIGGEVYASGEKSEDIKGWRVGVIKPEGNYTENAFIITLKNKAAATSGDYRNIIYLDNHKYSHTISSKTGYPVESNLISTTVISDNCMEADGYATALMAMSEKDALKFANDNHIAAILFIRNPDNTVKKVTSKLAEGYIGQ
jgi:thiamine biosynthesis lipoprotein